MSGTEEPNVARCRQCGATLGERASFCKQCGGRVDRTSVEQTPPVGSVHAATPMIDPTYSQASASRPVSDHVQHGPLSYAVPVDLSARSSPPAPTSTFEVTTIVRWTVAAVAIVTVVAFLTVVLLRSKSPASADNADKPAAAASEAPPPPPVETEREEIIRLTRMLMAGQQGLAQLNGSEAELVPPIAKLAKDIQFWGVFGNGSQYGDQAKSASGDADRIRQGIKKVRASVEALPLNFPYSQTKRTELVSELKRRESFLGELSERLGTASRDLNAFRSAFSYPKSVKALSDHTDKWRPPRDAIGDQIQAIRLAHGIADRDLVP